MFTYENGVYTFKSKNAGTYEFKIAVFATYADKLNYENYVKNNGPISNYNKLAKTGEDDTVFMNITNLTIEVALMDRTSEFT